jgi:hypothetical protein
MSGRLVLFVEGQGDAEAVPVLARQFLTAHSGWSHLVLDPNPFRVGELPALCNNDFAEWKRYLRAAGKRRELNSILAVVDGDYDKHLGKPFCAVAAARDLAEAGKTVGAGATFSLAVVIARCEFESWLIAGIESLVGKALPDGRIPLAEMPGKIPPEVEERPRDAKGWLARTLDGGYSPTRDQAPLTRLISVSAIQEKNVRSFRRFEAACAILVSAAAGSQRVISPPRT